LRKSPVQNYANVSPQQLVLNGSGNVASGAGLNLLFDEMLVPKQLAYSAVLRGRDGEASLHSERPMVAVLCLNEHLIDQVIQSAIFE
jgi:hypothetical protein